MADISTTAVTALFYLAFTGQIILISVLYPRKLAGRLTYVLEHFPPADYPKLYPNAAPNHVARMKAKIGGYLKVNYLIAVLGCAVAALMVFAGLSKGACAAYFILQAMPYLYLSVKEAHQFKAMRAAYSPRRRVAELAPRHLSDYIALPYVAVAVGLFVAWAAFYLTGKGAVSGWGVEVLLTLLLITGMNVAYVLIIHRTVSGRKLNPIAGQKDQRQQAETMVQTLVYSSIGVSLFMITIDAVRRYGFEDIGPLVTSLYMQLCIIAAVGLTLRKIRPETIDFDVYRADDASLPK